MKIAISCKQSDSGLGLSLGYLGKTENQVHSPFLDFLLAFFFFCTGNESSQSTTIYGATTGLQGLGGDLGCWKKPRLALTQDSKRKCQSSGQV